MNIQRTSKSKPRRLLFAVFICLNGILNSISPAPFRDTLQLLGLLILPFSIEYGNVYHSPTDSRPDPDRILFD